MVGGDVDVGVGYSSWWRGKAAGQTKVTLSLLEVRGSVGVGVVEFWSNVLQVSTCETRLFGRGKVLPDLYCEFLFWTAPTKEQKPLLSCLKASDVRRPPADTSRRQIQTSCCPSSWLPEFLATAKLFNEYEHQVFLSFGEAARQGVKPRCPAFLCWWCWWCWCWCWCLRWCWCGCLLAVDVLVVVGVGGVGAGGVQQGLCWCWRFCVVPTLCWWWLRVLGLLLVLGLVNGNNGGGGGGSGLC